MKLLDVYLMRKIAVNWASTLLGLLLMMILGDFAGTIKSLSHLAERLADKMEIFGILGGYYLCQIPQWLLIVIPASALLAATLLVNQINHRQEWLAMHSAGLSMHRMLAPCMLLLSVISGLLLWVNQECVLPSIRNASFSLREHSKSAKDRYTLLQTVTSSGDVFQGTWFQDENLLKDALLVKADETLVASEGAWKGDGWDFRSVRRYRPTQAAHPHEILSHEHWFWKTDLGPSELSQLFRSTDFLSRSQIMAQASRFPGERSLSMEGMDRLARPLTPWILLMVGLPLATSRHHPFLAAVRVAAVALGFTLLQILFYRLGTDGALTPLMASSLPLGLGLGTSLVLWARVRT